MLDPIAALGLASNVVQLVDFAARVLSKGSKQGRRKDQIDRARLTVITTDLTTLSKNLKRSSVFKVESPDPDENEKVIPQ